MIPVLPILFIIDDANTFHKYFFVDSVIFDIEDGDDLSIDVHHSLYGSWKNETEGFKITRFIGNNSAYLPQKFFDTLRYLRYSIDTSCERYLEFLHNRTWPEKLQESPILFMSILFSNAILFNTFNTF